MPPIIGYSKMANFHVLSLPGPGTVVLGIAWLLGPVALSGWSWRALRRASARRRQRRWLPDMIPRSRLDAARAAVVALAGATALTAAAPCGAAVLRVQPHPGLATVVIGEAAEGDTVLL